MFSNNNRRWSKLIVLAGVCGLLGLTACEEDVEVEQPVGGTPQGAETPVGEELGVDEGAIEDDWTRFGTWDTQADQNLTEQEFQKGVDTLGYFVTWDANSNGTIEPDEFGGVVFTEWDENADEGITEQEFNEGVNVWLDPDTRAIPEMTKFASWDANSDGKLDKSEYMNVVNKAETFKTWDRNNNNMLEPSEMAGGLFTVVDANDDGKIDTSEFQAQNYRPQAGDTQQPGQMQPGGEGAQPGGTEGAAPVEDRAKERG